MATTLSPVYKDLGAVHEASTLVEAQPEVLKSLAKLLLNYSLNDTFDIRLCHKHFDIDEDEQVIGFPGQDILLSIVCKKGETELPLDILRDNNIYPDPGGLIMPSEFFVNPSGEAIPYEFTYAMGAVCNTTRVLTKGFLTQWAGVLHDHNLVGLLGLSVRDEGMPENAYEISNPAARVNKLYYKDPSDGMLTVATTWQVVDNGDNPPDIKLCRVCGPPDNPHVWSCN